MLTRDEARSVITAAQERAREIGQSMNIAAVNSRRTHKAFTRMNTAWLGGIRTVTERLQNQILAEPLPTIGTLLLLNCGTCLMVT